MAGRSSRSTGDEHGGDIPLVDLGPGGQPQKPGHDALSEGRGGRSASSSTTENDPEPAEDCNIENGKQMTTRVRTNRIRQHQLPREMAYYKYELMTERIYLDLLINNLVSNPNPGDEGVVLKIAPGQYTCFPLLMEFHAASIYQVVQQMNFACALTVRVPWVAILLRAVTESGATRVPLLDGRRIEVLQTAADLVQEQQHHFAALIVDTGILLVWGDDPRELFGWAQKLQEKVLLMLASKGMSNDAPVKNRNDPLGLTQPHPVKIEYEDDEVQEKQRRVRLTNAWLISVSILLCLGSLGIGWRKVAMEIAVDGDWTRMLFMLVFIPMIITSQFFFNTLVGNFGQIFGPTSYLRENSKYYSGTPPPRHTRLTRLPHFTIQMPVHKESLTSVIKPTVRSLLAAISTYEMQGGSANLFINEDGMQLLSDEEAQARQEFYEEHGIGWVARPKHKPHPDLEAGEQQFLRRGKFKKASNMNYCLSVSNRVETKLLALERPMEWTQKDEVAAYNEALQMVLNEDGGRTWAAGNIRVGDLILVVDSDTRIPRDCLLDAGTEMVKSPEVGILQYTSGVVNVTDSFFEQGITWFTNLIYSAITVAVAWGDACPFVGHNAVLRWSALQEIAAYTDEDGYEKYWSESHVSEDFDMSLRLQMAGYSIRLASYAEDGFKEGVSLTVTDELGRWEKYAYGCNELIFHPLSSWFRKGPLTPLFCEWVACGAVPLAKKMTIMAYIGTYYAIAGAWVITLMNYFLMGWYFDVADKYYLDSFAVFVSVIAVFTVQGNVAYAVMRCRRGKGSLLRSLLESIKWAPMFLIFLGGISLHLARAILCHFLNIDMAWNATNKEARDVVFGAEVARVARDFCWTYFYCVAATVLMISGYYWFPREWEIKELFCIWPLATVVFGHAALPVLLNPALMRYSW